MRGYSYITLLIGIAAGCLLFISFRTELRTGIEYLRSSVIAQENVSERENASRVNKWAGVKLEKYMSGFRKPLYLTHSGDGTGKLYIVEKRGVVRVAEKGSKETDVFLDIADRVGDRGSEQGLLSIAFHPSYKNNGRLFVYYTDKSGDVVISEFSADPETGEVDTGSEKTILNIEEPASNHNGGQLKFGSDGYLYIGTGDGGSAGDPWGNAQDLGELLGKLLRIDVNSGDEYSIPGDNPFTENKNARDEIWAYGLRNPWRFSFDPETDDLYIADVGQNKWEEINYQPAESEGGENYGWNYLEGFNSFKMNDDVNISELEMPVMEYSHDHGCSVTGGYVYRGDEFEKIRGTYFFGDYCSGLIWGLRKNNSGDWEYARFLNTNIAISSFGIDENNDIYVIDFRKGDIYRLVVEE